jgi:hypothetical protein
VYEVAWTKSDDVHFAGGKKQCEVYKDDVEVLSLANQAGNHHIVKLHVSFTPPMLTTRRWRIHHLSDWFDLGALRTILLAKGPTYTLDPVATAHILLQALEGIRFASSMVYHTDLSSAEIVISSSGLVAVKDFHRRIGVEAYGITYVVDGVSKTNDGEWPFRRFYHHDTIKNETSTMQSLGIIAFEMMFRRWFWNDSIHLPMRKDVYIEPVVGRHISYPKSNAVAVAMHRVLYPHSHATLSALTDTLASALGNDARDHQTAVREQMQWDLADVDTQMAVDPPMRAGMVYHQKPDGGTYFDLRDIAARYIVRHNVLKAKRRQEPTSSDRQ